MEKITVYTPTYNRRNLLSRLYDSLCSQTVQDFVWLVIDDGSEDGTNGLLNSIAKKANFDVIYHYQQNQGMLGAHNTAHSLISTELAICIDSDDKLAFNGIELILQTWEKVKCDDKVAGIVGLDSFFNGEIIGGSFAGSLLRTKYQRVLKLGGDKKYVYRTDVLRDKGPYPVITGEKFPAQGYLYRKIDLTHDLITLNEILCLVEYQLDGNSNNKIQSYLSNPKGFALHREFIISNSTSLREKLRNAIHLVSSCIISGNVSGIFNKTNRRYTLIMLPLGLILYFFLRYKKSGSVNKNLNGKQ